MNEYDSNRIFDIVKEIGYEKSQNPENVDCFVINTCHIRDKAKEKVFHEVGRIKKIYSKKIKPIMVVAGCVAQAENQEMIKREPFIDIVIGPQSYHKINKILKNFQINKKDDETEFDTIAKFDLLQKIKNSESKVSSFLTIQEGCDKFCNFCVVPYTRGPECSRSFETILKEAEQLIKNGAREITLLGQNVNAYYYKEKNNEFRIADLLNHLEKFSELKRIRYTTSHPIDMTDDLIECYSSNKKLMPFLHLPIQSGSDKILHAMNRRHTALDYLRIIERLRSVREDMAMSGDFIVGFPGETDRDFADTINLINNVGYASAYSFKYSARPGTPAADKSEQVLEHVKSERLLALQQLLDAQQYAFNKNCESMEFEVLVEQKGFKGSKLNARTPYMQSVYFEGSESLIGKIVRVKVLDGRQNSLFAEIVS